LNKHQFPTEVGTRILDGLIKMIFLLHVIIIKNILVNL